MNSSLKLFNQTLFKIVLCFAVFTSLVLGGAGILVLCFGEAGHIAIEFAHNNPCHSSHDHSEKPSADPQQRISNEDCCSCFDIPITIDYTDQHLLNKNHSKITDPLNGGSVYSTSVTAGNTDRKSVSFLSHFPLPLSNSLDLVRTTVLLI